MGKHSKKRPQNRAKKPSHRRSEKNFSRPVERKGSPANEGARTAHSYSKERAAGLVRPNTKSASGYGDAAANVGPRAQATSGPRTGPQAFLSRIGGSSAPSGEGSGRHGKPSREENFYTRRPDKQKSNRTEFKEDRFSKKKRSSQFDPDAAQERNRPKKKSFGKGLEHGRSRGGKRGDSSVVTIQGEVQKNSRGFAFLLHKPEDIFIPPEFAAKLLTGDHVKVWINPRNKEVLKLETVKRIIKSFIGTYEAGFDRRIVVLADRTMREEVVIKDPPNLPGLKHGHKVLVEITKYEPRLEGKVVRSFGQELAPKYDTLAVVTRSQWPQEFSREVTELAEKLAREIQEKEAASSYQGRKDLRSKPFVTIDGRDSRDFDDAVCIEKTNSGFVLYVAIADVAEFVQSGSALDDDAYGRATSVYFPEWVIPMLPEALSNGACSLRPNEDKLTLTCEMHYDLSGKKRSIKIYESVIRSSRRCVYEDVFQEWKDGMDFWKHPFELYELIRSSRNKRGALDLDLPEAKLILDENADTIDIKKSERLDSHRLIEEFMIAANESVTEVMEREGWPFVYRVHEPPQSEALKRFERFAIALGLKPKLGEGKDPKLFSNFITTLKDNPFATTLYYLMLRSLKQARYDPMNLKHFGLASQAYTHFTSPIRRYPDLMVHRILKMYCRHDKLEGGKLAEFVEYLEEACEHCSKQERKAEDLDRQVIKVKKARFMAKHLGETFDARITNVTEAGVFVELEKWFVEGLVPINELGSDYYEFVESKMMLAGKRTGKKYKIGDDIEVCVLRTDVDHGFIDFTLAENLDSDQEQSEEEEDAAI